MDFSFDSFIFLTLLSFGRTLSFIIVPSIIKYTAYKQNNTFKPWIKNLKGTHVLVRTAFFGKIYTWEWSHLCQTSERCDALAFENVELLSIDV